MCKYMQIPFLENSLITKQENVYKETVLEKKATK